MAIGALRREEQKRHADIVLLPDRLVEEGVGRADQDMLRRRQRGRLDAFAVFPSQVRGDRGHLVGQSCEHVQVIRSPEGGGHSLEAFQGHALQRPVHRHESLRPLRKAAVELSRYGHAVAVAHQHSSFDEEIVQHRRDRASEEIHSVLDGRCVALAVSDEIHGDQPPAGVDALELAVPVRAVSGPAVNKDDGSVGAVPGVVCHTPSVQGSGPRVGLHPLGSVEVLRISGDGWKAKWLALCP